MKKTRYPQNKSVVSLFILAVLTLIGLLSKDLDKQKPDESKTVFAASENIQTPAAVEVSLKLYGVQRVVDGDTIVLHTGEHVRLIGIDTPESRPNERAKRVSERTKQDLETIISLGKLSKAFLAKLLDGQQVLLETDVGPRDRYDRLLAYVYLPVKDKTLLPKQYFVVQKNGKDCIFVNATLALAGYAAPLTVAPNVKYADLFESLYNDARLAKNGLWQENKADKVLAYRP